MINEIEDLTNKIEESLIEAEHLLYRITNKKDDVYKDPFGMRLPIIIKGLTDCLIQCDYYNEKE